ncbi:sigma-70 family RNA polymerase sigma factor [Jannaschia sp. R86511]|uniref:sigma-70 family RNA polymerase sigma factor n=1 Tax=Jannaschia sp. R86511 TaxID=3093853 RepID=UPI0036D22FA4
MSDEDEFRVLVRQESSRLLRLAYGVCGRLPSAEDALQTALERAYASWHLVRAADDRPAYLRRMVIREAVKEARRGARYSTLEDATPPEGATPIVPSEERLDLADALKALTPKQRAVVVLRYLDDQSVAEVARILRVSEGTVKRQCYDAVRTLRPLLRPTSPADAPEGVADGFAESITRRRDA